jgi:predicted metal-dependent phosphoesterase TrpH
MNKLKKADLHIHTTASDGRLTPGEIVNLASQKDLEIISITDHDTIKGYKEALPEAEKSGIELIPGVEITSDYEDEECHLLAYCFDLDNEKLTDFLNAQSKIRIDRAGKIIERLNKLGFDITYDEVKAMAGRGVITRPHIAAVMVEKGFVSNPKEAFIRYLGNHAPAYYKCDYKSVEEVIHLVHDANGVVILAHPSKNYSDSDLDNFIRLGIDGFEYIHPSHDYVLQKKYEQLAEKNNLLKTGGSDFHDTKFDDKLNFGVIAVNTSIAKHLVDYSLDRKHFHSSL